MFLLSLLYNRSPRRDRFKRRSGRRHRRYLSYLRDIELVASLGASCARAFALPVCARAMNACALYARVVPKICPLGHLPACPPVCVPACRHACLSSSPSISCCWFGIQLRFPARLWNTISHKFVHFALPREKSLYRNRKVHFGSDGLLEASQMKSLSEICLSRFSVFLCSPLAFRAQTTLRGNIDRRVPLNGVGGFSQILLYVSSRLNVTADCVGVFKALHVSPNFYQPLFACP